MAISDEQWGKVQEWMENIDKAVDCVPGLCKTVASHTTEIAWLKWMVSIVLAALVGLAFKAFSP